MAAGNIAVFVYGALYGSAGLKLLFHGPLEPEVLKAAIDATGDTCNGIKSESFEKRGRFGRI